MMTTLGRDALEGWGGAGRGGGLDVKLLWHDTPPTPHTVTHTAEVWVECPVSWVHMLVSCQWVLERCELAVLHPGAYKAVVDTQAKAKLGVPAHRPIAGTRGPYICYFSLSLKEQASAGQWARSLSFCHARTAL